MAFIIVCAVQPERAKGVYTHTRIHHHNPLPSVSSASSVPSAIQTKTYNPPKTLFSYPGECLDGIHTVDCKSRFRLFSYPANPIILKILVQTIPSSFSVLCAFSDSDNPAILTIPSSFSVFSVLYDFCDSDNTLFSYPANPEILLILKSC